MQQIQSYSFLSLDHQRNRCPRCVLFCQHVLVFGVVLLLFFSRQGTSLHMFSGTKSNYRDSLILWAECVCCFCEILLVFGQIRHSHASRSVSCCIFLLHNWDFFLPSNIPVSCNFSRGVRTAFVSKFHPTFSDDESSLAQIKFNLQELSCLICLHQEHRVQQQNKFRIRVLESKCHQVCCCVFLDALLVWAMSSCDRSSRICIVDQCCTVFAWLESLHRVSAHRQVATCARHLVFHTS